MKKLLIIFLSTFSLTVVAQDKRVAILNPEAATSEVTTIHRSMIRGEMEKAICRQSGYTAFTRQDIDQIAKELNFQQSGMVDDNTRKLLGGMKGVDYLCVTRITKEGNNYYLEAKFVDVESGTILNPATKYGELTGGSLASMLAACEELAAELVGNKSVSTTSTSSHNNIINNNEEAYVNSEPCGLANKSETIVNNATSSSQQNTTNKNQENICANSLVNQSGSVVTVAQGLPYKVSTQAPNYSNPTKAYIHIRRPFQYVGSGVKHFIDVMGVNIGNLATNNCFCLAVNPGYIDIIDYVGNGRYAKVKEKNNFINMSLDVEAGKLYYIKIDEALNKITMETEVEANKYHVQITYDYNN